MLYTKLDLEREIPSKETAKELALRPPFRRDYSRLIHSPAFRRLQGKTQLFPGVESDFFRNRLTHSLEVAQIAKSIAIRINENGIPGKNPKDKLNLDLVELAGLAHDLGHPPFGHNGEKALDECMRDYGGFEGNAQTLRILSRLEKKGTNVLPFSGPKSSDSRTGLNLTYRSLAAILKYDQEIPIQNKKRPKPDKLCKGFYSSEASLVKRIKKSTKGTLKYRGEFKTIECQIMDLADDIAYSTYDLEDALKAGFISPIDILNDSLKEDLMERVAKKVSERAKIPFTADGVVTSLLTLFFRNLFERPDIVPSIKSASSDAEIILRVAREAVISYESSISVSRNGYYRNQLTSSLVDTFVRGVEFEWNSKAPVFSKIKFSDDVLPLVETLKNYTFEKFIESSRLKVSEYRGKDIVTDLFKALADGGSQLLPDDFRDWYEAAPDKASRYRVICDFIAGMTDSYAIEFYGRLKSESPQTIFKPI